LQGVISNLNRGQRATGPVFEALLSRVQALFQYDYTELLTIHQEQAPTDLVVDIPRLYQRLNPTRPSLTWQPQDLPEVFDYLPQDTPLALYGIGPAWLYAAVASYIFPIPFYQFDARRGWVEPVRLSADPTAQVPLSVTIEQSEPYLRLKLDLPEDYLIYQPELAAPLPSPPQTQGVVLNGKLPNWLYTGLALFYRSAPWVAIYYPHLNQAIVVASQNIAGQYTVGQSLPLDG
jgi:CRISPR-associated protein Csx3